MLCGNTMPILPISFQIEVSDTAKEEGGYVLVRCLSATCPDVVVVLAELDQLLAHDVGTATVGVAMADSRRSRLPAAR